MKKTVSKILLSILLFILLANPASAQIWSGKYDVTCNVSGEGPCTWCDALKVTSNIVDFITKAAFGVSALFITIGAILIMIAGGNEKRYELGKSAVTNAILGLVITLSAWIIVNSLINIIAPNSSGIFPWNQIQC